MTTIFYHIFSRKFLSSHAIYAYCYPLVAKTRSMLLKEFPCHPHLWELQSLLMQLGLSQLSLPSMATASQWEQLLLPQVRLMTIKYKFSNINSSCCFHNCVFFYHYLWRTWFWMHEIVWICIFCFICHVYAILLLFIIIFKCFRREIILPIHITYSKAIFINL